MNRVVSISPITAIQSFLNPWSRLKFTVECYMLKSIHPTQSVLYSDDPAWHKTQTNAATLPISKLSSHVFLELWKGWRSSGWTSISRIRAEWYLQGWSIVRIKKELETSRIPSPRGKRRWAVRTIGDILSNEKYARDSFYGQTVTAEYPATKRVRNSPDEIFRAENHHPPILDKASFDQVQEMRKMRSNIELDEQGNKVRKITHYSMKRTLLI